MAATSDTSIWVVAASKYGSTREIGEAIASELAPLGSVELHDPEELDGFDGADAVVLGSAIYGGRWLGPARALAETQAEELATRPTWLCSCGPIGNPPKPEAAGPEGITELVERTGAREHRVFSGKLDYSALRRVERLMVRSLHAPEGDFRDWPEIRAWAAHIAAELSAARTAG